jgi:Secretion system C-terminal sorting domain
MIMKYCSAFLLSLFLVYPAHTQQNNPLYASNSVDEKQVHWLFNDTNIYDITGAWSHLTPMPDSLFCVNSYYWSVNNKVFVCGGAKYPLVPQSKCRWYNINSNQYESAADLPQGRWSGKLVRVRDSLFLIGSIDSTFNSADGLIFRYSLNQNSWVISDTMPPPLVHECAVSVINDSLILTVGGSTNAFLSPTNIVRIYNPWNRTWKVTTSYPVNLTSAHADYLGDDSTVVVLGGYNAGNLDIVYRGFISYLPGDTVEITWAQFGSSGLTPFGIGVYRVAGARWNDYVLFGPAMNDVSTVNQIWGLKANGDTTWLNFTPRSLDSAGNISTYGVKSGPDTNYFFLFGGFKNPVVLSLAQKFTFATPPPIGITVFSNEIPKSFKLHQNYPNPFNPVTKIRFEVPASSVNEPSGIRLRVYDVLGRIVKTIIDGNIKPGTYEVEFDGKDLSSGVYFYVLHTSEVSIASKMILSK